MGEINSMRAGNITEGIRRCYADRTLQNMALDTFNAVAFTLTFLMPGFVWSAVLSTLVPRRPQEGEVRFLEFLTLSFVNNAAWAGVVVYLWRSGSLYRSPE